MTDDLIKDLQEYKERIEVAGGVCWENPEICKQAVCAIIEARAQVAAAFEMAAGIANEADSLELATNGTRGIVYQIMELTPTDAAEALRQIKNEAYQAGQEMMRQWAAITCEDPGVGMEWSDCRDAILNLPIGNLPEDQG